MLRQYAPARAAQAQTPHPALAARLRWQVPVIFFVLFAVCALPVLIAKVPPLLDYPAHLARIYIITHPDNALLSQYYAVEWKVISSMALDIVIPVLMNFADIFAAGKLFILLTVLLVVSGTFALNHVLYGEWHGPALAFIFIFNGVFWDGFLPYIFAIGVALWATAGWIALRERSWLVRGLFSTGAVTVLFLSHLAGVGLYLLAIFCYEAARLHRADWRGRQLVADAAVMIAPLLVLIPLLTANTGARDVTSLYFRPLSTKWIGPYLAVRSANLVLDAVVVGCLVVFLGCLAYLKRLTLPRVAGLFLVLAALTYLITPGAFFDGSEIDIRLPAAFVFFAIGFARWRVSGPLAALVFNGVVGALLAVRVAGVILAWQAYNAMLSEYEASFAQIAAGSRVLVVSDLSSAWRGSGNKVTLAMDRDAIGHAATLAAIERSSLVSDVFGDPNNKIYGVLRVKAPYRDAIPSREVPVEMLSSVLPNAGEGSAGTLSARDEQLRAQVRDWPQHYDYLYVQYAGPGTQLQVPQVTLVFQGSSFQLYRIQNPSQ